jgi:hypothetical protein
MNDKRKERLMILYRRNLRIMTKVREVLAMLITTKEIQMFRKAERMEFRRKIQLSFKTMKSLLTHLKEINQV